MRPWSTRSATPTAKALQGGETPSSSGQEAPTCHTLDCAPDTGACTAYPSDEGTACSDNDDPCAAASACDASNACVTSEAAADDTSCGDDGETCQLDQDLGLPNGYCSNGDGLTQAS